MAEIVVAMVSAASSLGDLVLETERALLAKEQRRKLERENNLAQKEVAPLSVFTDALLRRANKAVPILESLPLEMRRQNPALTGHDISLVKKSIAGMRNYLAEIRIDDDNQG